MSQEARARVKFYKDGDAMSITTTHIEATEFLAECAERLGEMIEVGLYKNDWEFQLRFWLPQIVELSCKLKGYKAEVDVQQLLIAGGLPLKDSEQVWPQITPPPYEPAWRPGLPGDATP